MNRARLQRYRMPAAWTLIALLVVWLGAREGLAQWRELAQWRALAESAAGLDENPPLALERLRQSAQMRQIALKDVEPLDSIWHLRGQVADEANLQQWLMALQADGVRLLQWGVDQDAQGLRFELRVRP